MTKLLIRLVKNNNSPYACRSGFAKLSGITGIICNLILCAVKFAVGTLTGSVSVTADGINNLSDSASNIVTLMGTKLSDKPDDKEHPFGHGRIEYVSALIVAISIFVVSFELAKGSVEKIIHPAEMKFSIWYIIILACTVFVKLWMAFFNRKLYKLSQNLNLKAVMQDSLNDCVATASTILSLVLSHVLPYKGIDGIIGISVSVFIFFSGVEILKKVVSPLLGEAPNEEITNRIEEIIKENPLVLGVHDLVIHSYGANKILASADAEVDANSDIFELHNAIDVAEKRILDELGIVICIHMDPVDKTDTETQKYRLIADGIIRNINSEYTLHDFLITEKNGGKHISFDLVIPFEEDAEQQEIHDKIEEEFTALCPEITLEVNIEHSYV